jgi:hypothetical protein
VKNGYRFFFHWRKREDRWTVHFRGKCIDCGDVVCLVPCETKKNKRQPVRVCQGFCMEVQVVKDRAYITW